MSNLKVQIPDYRVQIDKWEGIFTLQFAICDYPVQLQKLFDSIPVLRPPDQRKADIPPNFQFGAAVLHLDDASVRLAVVGVRDPPAAPFVPALCQAVGYGEALHPFVLAPARALVAHGIAVFARLAIQGIDGGDKRVALHHDVHDGFGLGRFVVNGFPPACRGKGVGGKCGRGAQ